MSEKSDHLWTQIAVLGPVGRLPRAPGTWGSAAAALAAPLIFLPLPVWLRLAVLAVLFAAGSRACAGAERALGVKDPGVVVIDEVLGQWVTFTVLLDWTWASLAAGFLLFRLFDIAKPWPVRRAESWWDKGASVMVDDLLAGVYAGLVLAFLRFKGIL